MIHVALFGIEAGLGVLLTYLVHSSVWIGGALLLTRAVRGLSPAARHVVWRVALLGPLASSALALSGGHRWQWTLTTASPVGEALVAAVPDGPPHSLPHLGPVDFPQDAPSAAAPLSVELRAPLPRSAQLAAGWAFVALAHLLLLARAALRQRRALTGRAPVDHDGWVQGLERLAQRARIRQPIRLSCCAGAQTPLVLSAREICLPERALAFDADAIEAVLAHELAHVERRDGPWTYAALFLQALFWFQPLQRRARIELQESAELAADDRAVELTGDALALARTLTQVAGWVRGTTPAPAVAMARAGSPIVERVTRLVEARDARFAARTPGFAVTVLVAIGACSPSVGAPEAQPPRVALDPPAAPDTPVHSELGAGPDTTPREAASSGQNDTAEAECLAADRKAAAAGCEHATQANAAPGHAQRLASREPSSASGGDIVCTLPDAPGHVCGENVAGVEPKATAYDQCAALRAWDKESAWSCFRAQECLCEHGRHSEAIERCALGEFSQAVPKLALAEHQLQERLRLAEEATRAAHTDRARADLERLRSELAATRAQRETLQRDFEAGMKVWSKDFEQRFQRDFGPRFEAWGREFGRRMESMAKDLERKLSDSRSFSMPELPSMPPVAAVPLVRPLPPVPPLPLVRPAPPVPAVPLVRPAPPVPPLPLVRPAPPVPPLPLVRPVPPGPSVPPVPEFNPPPRP
jgi:hypothetical protein